MGHEIGSALAGDELRARDHRVVESVAPGFELDRPFEVIDEDVGVDENVS